jgi:hypothetical protein
MVEGVRRSFRWLYVGCKRVVVDVAKVMLRYFLLLTFLIIVKWFRDVTDRV